MRTPLHLSVAGLLCASSLLVGTVVVSTAASAEVFARDAAAASRVGCYGHPATIVGTRGDDVIVGTPDKDVIVARAGNDVVRSRGGGDLVCGGPGDDRLVSRARRPGGSTLLQGGPGADRLVAVRSGADLLTGGSGPDKLTSTSDHASSRNLSGGPGVDVLTAAGDADITLWLTADGDHVRTRHTSSVFLFYEASPGPVEVDMAARTVRLIGAADGDHITYLTGPPALYEYLFVYGTAGDDRMIGSDDDDYFYALAGNDVLEGLGGHDVLKGFEGNDVLNGGDGDDGLFADEGADTLDGGEGTDIADGGPGTDTCVNAEDPIGCSP